MGEQIAFLPEIEQEEYEAFKDKFKPKLTTDDCYTPPKVYDAVADWVAKEYNVSRENFVRPFYPGGDYAREKYGPEDIVVDNPPFSILSEIKRTYWLMGVRYFLFAPALTLFTPDRVPVCHLSVGATVTYENGAEVNTSFITNLEQTVVRSAPDLYEKIEQANKESRDRKQQPKYEYPDSVLTASAVARFSKYGVRYAVARDDCAFIRGLDSQRDKGKSIYGSGYILSSRACAERQAAERINVNRWKLSERELEIIRQLDQK